MNKLKMLESQAVTGGQQDLNLQWNPQPHGQVGGGYGQDTNGNHYGEIHGNVNIGPGVELHGNVAVGDNGNAYHVGGNWNF